MQGTSLTIGFKGGVTVNGIPAQLEGGNRHIDVKGGFISSQNTEGDAIFGRIVSVDPASNDKEFIVGWAKGLVVVGPLLNNQGIRENDPAKPDYILNQLPASAVIKGGLWFGDWVTPAGALIAPKYGAIVVFNEKTGQIAFQADGTVNIEAGYKPLLAAVTVVDLTANGVCINFEPQSYAILPTEDIT